MAYKYSKEFQGSPCNYEWYQRFSNAVNTGDQECTLQVFDVVEGKLKPIAYLTNLYCTDELEITHGDETYTIPVYTLGEVSFDDAIDPLMVESKIPSFDFTLTFEHITRDYTLEELDAITKTFEDKVVKIYRGFFSYTGQFRNELGTANLSYGQFEHDLACMGTYVIQESEYDYTAYTISCSGESLVFSVLRDAKFYSSDSYWNQRYPYPYDDDRYLLGYPADKILDGSLFGQLNYKGLPLFGKGSDVEGLSTKHICDTLWIQDPKTSDDPIETWNEHIFEYNLGPYEGKYQFTQTGEAIDFNAIGVWWQNGDEVPKTDWVPYYYYDSDASGTFSEGDTMVVPLYGGETEIFTEQSTIYLMGETRYLWNGQQQSLTVRWKSLTGTEPGAVRSFSVYEHGEETPLQDIQGSRYILDSDGNYYTEATFTLQEIGVYDLKCWYGTYQFDASITFAITPVFNVGEAPGVAGNYLIATINGKPSWDTVDDYSKLTSVGLPYHTISYTITTEANIPIQPGIPPFAFDWSFRSNELELQRLNTEYYVKDLVEPTDLTSLCNTWSDTTMDTGLMSFFLMNNLHIVPTQSSDGVNDGDWILVNGLEPTKYPFRDTEATLQATNGKHFPELADERYKINVAMVLSDGFSKNQLDIEAVTHTRESLMNVGNLSGEESESFSLPTKDRVTSSVDIDAEGNPIPSDSENGYAYTTLLPLSSDVWFDTKNVSVMNGDTEVGKLFGTDQAASALMGGKNYAVRGNSLVAYDVLWNDKLNLTKNLEQPFTLKVAKYSPTEYYVDVDGNTTSEDDELTAVEAIGAYYGYNGLSERMVNRSNGDWLNPLYELQWSMVDDPSLRVGTLVYVPVHNQYVETYITEQKRSFDGSGQLDCVGWAIRETDEKVLLAEPVNCHGVHYTGNPNDETKGDFVTFEWEENVGWDGLYGQLVRGVLTYESKDGSTVVKLADQFFTSGDPMAYTLNWFTLEQNTGMKLDTMAENGDFYIELFYYTYEVHGKTKFEYENIIPAHQPFSYLYAGYTVASNKVAPIAFNHYLIG